MTRLRAVAPFMQIAAVVCSLVAAATAGPPHLFAQDLLPYERLLMAVAWLGYGAALYVTARLAERDWRYDIDRGDQP